MKSNQETAASLDLELNQTQFIEDSAYIEKTSAKDETTPTNKNKLYILGGLGTVALLMIISLFLMIFFKPKREDNQDVDVQVTTEVKPIGPLERQLMILERDIDTADPLESALSFPPVDFELSLQDATTLQQP